MKIALINPPEENRVFTEVPSKVNLKSGILPPLGLLYIESYIHKHTSHHIVRIIDCPAEEYGYDALEKELREFAPDIIGITGHTHNLIDMLKTSQLYKNINPDGIVVWGGSHASAFSRQSMTFPETDFVIYGEGEVSFKRLVDNIEKKDGDFSGIKGLLFRKNGEVVRNEPSDYVMNLDELPHPRRTVLNVKKYYYTIGKETVASGFVSARGCPYHCTFCCTPGKTFRSRSAGDVVDEMEECHALGIKELYFVDDTFNVDQPRVIEICNEIIRRGINISWNFRGRINLITKEQLELAEKAGCTRIQLGIETGTDEGMKRLKKGLKVEDVRRVFKWLKKSKMTSVAYFMIGCPHEKNREDVLKTIEFAKEIDPDYVLFGVLTPYPDTAVYEEGVERGLIDPCVWENFVTNPSPDFHPQVWTEFMTREQLEELLDLAYKKFYRRPGYMFKRLLEIKSGQELWRKIKAGLNIIR
ncbi:MAG: B12-binding domain-containing radical SAM protein [Candidatus Eremiobacteraeota bacterium]|nr:B12-binding domain-containing radical SAM protein [Candidatus Eremiobacteraeota bacterium]